MTDIQKVESLVTDLRIRHDRRELSERQFFETLFDRLKIAAPEYFPAFDIRTLEEKLSDNAATLKGIELQLDELVKGYRPQELTPEERQAADKQDRQYQIYRTAIELLKAGGVDFSDVPFISTDERCDILYRTAESFYDRFFIAEND